MRRLSLGVWDVDECRYDSGIGQTSRSGITFDFSPEGERILFSRTEVGGSYVSLLWSINAYGSNLWGSKTRIHKIDAGWVASLAPCDPSPTSSWFASSEYDWPKSPTLELGDYARTKVHHRDVSGGLIHESHRMRHDSCQHWGA